MSTQAHRAPRLRPLEWAWIREPASAPFAVLACIGLAALSAAVLPTVPSYDPFSWIVWGREVTDPHLSFVTGGGPSWKPLPVLFTTVWGLFGGAAPTLWVITARAGGLLALAGAWRLGARLVAGVSPQRDGVAAAIAGLVAVLGVALTQDFAYYFLRGTSEPMLVGAVLWAIERHLAGRRAQAYALVVAAALIRPETWPFLGLYALWLLRGDRTRLPWLAGGLIAVPVLWFVPTWIGSGEPFLAASHAKAYDGHLGRHPALEALRRAADLQVLPILIAAAAAVGLAWRARRRQRASAQLIVALLAVAGAWIVLVVAMVLAGYPGLERFFLPAAAVLCALAGAGVAELAVLAGRRASRATPGARSALVAAGFTLAVLAASVPLARDRIDAAWDQRAIAARAVHRLDELSAALAAAGGRSRVLPCRSSVAAVNHGVQTALAWKLHVTLPRVLTTLRHPGVLFVGPHDSIDGGPAPVKVRAAQSTLIARAGAWRVSRIVHAGRPDRCAGA